MIGRCGVHRSKTVLLAGAASCVLLVAACSDDEVAPETHRLELSFDEVEASELTSGPVTLGESAGRPVEGEVLLDGIDAAPLREGPGGGLALLLPGEPASSDGVAAVKVDPPDPDTFSPGKRTFTFGADIALSGGGDGDDAGANVVQRGLFSDSGQYKLQVDAGVPSCRVAGTEGDVLVKSGAALSPGSWHRVRCTRTDDAVTLTVQPWEVDEWGDAETFSRSGSIGAVELSSTTPLSVGAKLSAAGSLVPTRPDQYRGLIDSVVVEVG